MIYMYLLIKCYTAGVICSSAIVRADSSLFLELTANSQDFPLLSSALSLKKLCCRCFKEIIGENTFEKGSSLANTNSQPKYFDLAKVRKSTFVELHDTSCTRWLHDACCKVPIWTNIGQWTQENSTDGTQQRTLIAETCIFLHSNDSKPAFPFCALRSEYFQLIKTNCCTK